LLVQNLPACSAASAALRKLFIVRYTCTLHFHDYQEENLLHEMAEEGGKGVVESANIQTDENRRAYHDHSHVAS
jgi:hypothetical protein